MTASLVVDALNMAAWARRHANFEDVVCHSDAGRHYTSLAYTERLAEIGAIPSVGTVGDSFDNALAESMFAIFKTELFRNPAVLSRVGGHWKGLDDIELETAKWVPWFNDERIHGELGDRTPADVEADYSSQPQSHAA